MNDDMESMGWAALERRLVRAERAVRRLRAVVLLGAPIALGWGLLGAAQPDEVPEALRARRVQMVDADGRVRAELAIDDEGAAGLFVRDVDGRPRSLVIHDAAQSGLFLLDDAGTVRLGAAQFAHGGGGLALHGAASKGATVLYHKGEGSLAFYDDDGTVRRRLGPDPGAEP